MDTTDPYPLAQIQGMIADALRVRAVAVSLPLPLHSRHPDTLSSPTLTKTSPNSTAPLT